MAITWRNVEGPSFKEAILAGTAAQQQMSSGFDSFNKILEQETKTNIANWDNTKQNNTQEAMNELMRYRTPEEYQAAQASGAFDALRQRYGAQMDQEAFRTAVDGRLTTLQQRATAGIDFKNKSLADTLRPQEQAALALVANDPSKLPSFLAANPELNNFMGGTLAAKGVENARATDLHKYAGNKDVRDGEQLQSTITHQRAIERISQAQAQASLISARAHAVAASNKGSKGGKLYSPEEQQAIDASKYGEGSLDAKGGIEQVAQNLKNAGWDSDKVSNAMAGLLQEFPDGKVLLNGGNSSIGVPVSTITSYMLKNGNNWFFNEGSSAASQFKTTMRRDNAFVNELIQVDELINGNAARAIANKADPAAAKERARSQSAEEDRGANTRTVTNPLYTALGDFPLPSEPVVPLFPPIVRPGLKTLEDNPTRADVILRKQLRESRNPISGMNLIR